MSNSAQVNKKQSLSTIPLSLNPLTSETIQNKKLSSEIGLIYLENSVILQLKKKNQPVKSYYCVDPAIAKRIKSAWEWEAEDELIATASAVDDSLLVTLCDLTTWSIPFQSLPCLEKVQNLERANFELDEDGSYLYWECAELHLDVEDILAAVDPQFKEQLLAQKLEYNKAFGRAIARLRQAHHLTQDQIKGISARHIRRIENEGHRPSLDTLKKLALAHGLDLETYLEKVNEGV